MGVRFFCCDLKWVKINDNSAKKLVSFALSLSPFRFLITFEKFLLFLFSQSVVVVFGSSGSSSTTTTESIQARVIGTGLHKSREVPERRFMLASHCKCLRVVGAVC